MLFSNPDLNGDLVTCGHHEKDQILVKSKKPVELFIPVNSKSDDVKQPVLCVYSTLLLSCGSDADETSISEPLKNYLTDFFR